VFRYGKLTRIQERVRLAPSTKGEREVKKLVENYMRPINHSAAAVGSATNFTTYVDKTYKTVVLPLMATTTKGRYQGIVRDYLAPAFGDLSLGDVTPLTVQRYFSNPTNFAGLGHESIDKIRDVLSSIMRSATEYGLLEKNPVENIRIPRLGPGRRKPNQTLPLSSSF